MPTYTWTIAPLDGVPCGYCGERIAEGAPMEFIERPGLTRKLVRCVRHAHTAVDEAAIDHARHGAEVRRLEELARPEPPPTLANARPMRAPLKRPVQAFSKVADVAGSVFDPRAAQANDLD